MPTDLSVVVRQHRSPCGVSDWIFFNGQGLLNNVLWTGHLNLL